ncbi:MAG: hypothetical protein K2N65_02225 [Anaeroplasmataceae bacterium]|nr:hypothetical protein [Anaeroplasmataceae bacterium]
MNYKERYIELRKAMKCLKTIHAFEQFDFTNFFYLIDDKTKGIVLLSEELMAESSGIQIHLGESGINYLYDSFLSKTGFILNGLCADMLTVSILKKESLLPQDIAFLKKYHIRLSSDFNIIPFEFREGYDCRYMSLKKMEMVISYIYYLLSLIKNEREDILQCFSEDKIVLAAFDTINNLYEVRYADDVTLGNMPRLKKANSAFALEYKNSVYVDDVCYVCRYYAPTKNEYGCYDSILLGYYEKKKTHFSTQISCKPHQITDYIVGFLDELFKREGLPTKLIFNDRRITAFMLKTLTALNIEVEFSREIEVVDTLFFEIMTDQMEKLEEGEKKQNPAFVS